MNAELRNLYYSILNLKINFKTNILKYQNLNNIKLYFLSAY